jgi:hypothetical protein
MKNKLMFKNKFMCFASGGKARVTYPQEDFLYTKLHGTSQWLNTKLQKLLGTSHQLKVPKKTLTTA